MPRIMIVVLVVLVILAGLLATRIQPVDQRILELTARHSAEQVAQSERLATWQQQWQTELNDLYEQRDQLESERRQLAIERQRAPVIAESITCVGTLALALLPIAVSILLLRRARDEEDSESVAELLVTDLVSANPKLFTRRLPSMPISERLASDPPLPLPESEVSAQ